MPVAISMDRRVAAVHVPAPLVVCCPSLLHHTALEVRDHKFVQFVPAQPNAQAHLQAHQ
jgi:hypothetical protein